METNDHYLTSSKSLSIHILDINLDVIFMGFYGCRLILPSSYSKFLHHFKLLVDLRNKRLINSKTCLSALVCFPSPSAVSPHFFVPYSNQFHELLSKFSDITWTVFHKTLVPHHIITKGPLVMHCSKLLATNKLKVAKEESSYMLDLGIICTSSNKKSRDLQP